jgi:hypothetical protein
VEKELLRAIDESPGHFRAALALGLTRDVRGDNTTGLPTAAGLTVDRHVPHGFGRSRQNLLLIVPTIVRVCPGLQVPSGKL